MTEARDIIEKIYSPMILSLSLRNLRLNKFRTALSMIGIVIGVFAICSLGMVGAAFTENINQMVAENANTLTLSSLEEKNIDGTIVHGFSEKDINDIENAVKAVTTDYEIITENSGTKYITVGNEGVYAYLTGIDTEGIESVVGMNLIEGTIPKSANGVLVMKKYAESEGLHVNSRLATTDVDGNEIKLRVTGILKEDFLSMIVSATSSGSCVLTVNLDGYRNLLGIKNNLYDVVIVKVDDPLLLNSMEQAVDREMNGKSFKSSDDRVSITNSLDTVETLNTILGLTMVLGTVVSAISLLVASVAIVNVMMMSVKERTREVGILRSIGTKKSQIRQMFMYEAAIIGFIGAVIGTIFSCMIVPLILLIMFDSAELMTNAAVISYIPVGILVGIAVCLAAGLYPALRAANMNPVEAMATD